MTDEPPRIARLPHDARGYPIPWNVLRADDGTPFFTVNDDRKAWAALRGGLCPLCGVKLGRWKWFVGGPRSAFDPDGWYLDLPGHHDCVIFALATCPYLAAPKYAGRVDVVNAAKLPPEARILLDETIIADRPEMFVTVGANEIEVKERSLLLPYVRPARPHLGHEFWRHGKQVPAHLAIPMLRGLFGPQWEIPEVG